MKTTEEMIAVMQAYIDGKKIEETEVKCVMYDWTDCPNPIWNWGEFDYRIKPDLKCRPYAGGEEAYREIHRHGGWVVDSPGEYHQISGINEAYIMIGMRWHAFSTAAKDFTWADDGTPCGVLEEE